METTAGPASSRLADWFMRPDSAVNLAVLRVTFCILVFGSSADDVLRPRTLPTTTPVAPDLLGFLLVELPREPQVLRLVAAGLTICAVAGALGYRTRWAMAGILVLGLYHYGVPQIFGKVDHNHHLLWVAFVLALTPCGDALSLDSRGRIPPRSVRYGFPLRVVWILLGLSYFFAGFWKLLAVGPGWASPRNMSGIMWSEWIARGGYEPTIDIAGNRLALLAGGVLTLVIELGFVFLVLHRSTRWLAIVGGVGFHLGVGLTIGIWFVDLPFLYVALIDWTKVLDRIERTAASRRSIVDHTTDLPRSVIVLCAILLGAVVLAGASRSIDGWPVASYPDFGYRVEVVHRVELLADGEPVRPSVLRGLSRLQRFRLLSRATRDEQAMASLSVDLQERQVCAEVPGAEIEIARQQFRTTVGDPVPDGEAERFTVLRCPR